MKISAAIEKPVRQSIVKLIAIETLRFGFLRQRRTSERTVTSTKQTLAMSNIVSGMLLKDIVTSASRDD